MARMMMMFSDSGFRIGSFVGSVNGFRTWWWEWGFIQFVVVRLKLVCCCCLLYFIFCKWDIKDMRKEQFCICFCFFRGIWGASGKN